MLLCGKAAEPRIIHELLRECESGVYPWIDGIFGGSGAYAFGIRHRASAIGSADTPPHALAMCSAPETCNRTSLLAPARIRRAGIIRCIRHGDEMI